MEATLAVLNDLREEGFYSAYAIGGAVAVLFYAEPVLTYDLDVFVLLAATESGSLVDLSPLYQRLQSRGYRPEREAILIEGIPVQFIPAYNPLVEEAVREASEVPYGDLRTRVLSLEHLLAIMLQTGRAKDRERLASTLEQMRPDQSKLQSILIRHGLVGMWENFVRGHGSA